MKISIDRDGNGSMDATYTRTDVDTDADADVALALRIIGARKLPGVSQTLAVWTASFGFIVSMAMTAYNISKTL